MSIDQMKVKKYTCSIKNDRFQFMNLKNIIILIDLRNAVRDLSRASQIEMSFN